MQIFELMGSIAIEGLDSVSSGMQGIGFSLTNLGNNITNMGKALYDGITKPLIGLVESGVTYNMTMEDLTTSFDVMLGSAEKAGKMVENLKKMGAATPFDTVQLAEYTKTMLAFGYTEANVIPIMSRLGDVSLGNNEKMSSLTRTMGQINSLGKLQGGDLNQLIGQGWNPLNEITKKTGETMEKVRDRMSKGKVTYKEVEDALISVTSKGGTFYEGMAKGSQTLSGRLSTLRDNFDSFIGSAVKPLSNFIGTTLVPMLTKLTAYFNDLSTPVKTLILVFAGLFAAIGPIIIVFGSLITFSGMVATSIGVLAGIFSGIGLVIPIIVVAIGALIAAFAGLILSSSKVRDNLKSHFNDMISKIKQSAEWIKIHVNDIQQALKGILVGINTNDFTLFGEAMAKMFPNNVVQIGVWVNKFKEFKAEAISLKNTIIDFATRFKEKMIETKNSVEFKTMLDSFNSVKVKVVELIDNLVRLGKAIGAIEGKGEDGKGKGDSKSSKLKDLIVDIGNVVKGISVVIGWISKFIGFFANLQESANKTSSSIKSFEGSVKKSFTEMYSAISSTVSSIVNTIVTWFGKLPGMVGGVINSLRSTIVGTFNSIYSSVSGTISSLVNTISSKFSSISSIVGWVSSAFNNLSSSIGGVINKISNIRFPSPPSWLKGLPGFADGVRNFGGGLAVVGERGPEIVSLPMGSDVYTNAESIKMIRGRSQIQTDGNNKSSNSIIININYPSISNKYDINKIGADIVSALRRQGIRTI